MEEHKQPPKTTLRHFKQSDADALMAWASDPRVMRFSRRGPLANRDEALHYITNIVLPHPWIHAICVEDHPVGSIAIQPGPSDSDRCRASLSYYLAYNHWGRGIATEAAKRAAAMVFAEKPELERLEAMADVENRASQRVLEKTGFVREGVLRKYTVVKGEVRDLAMYSLLRSEVGKWEY